MANLIEVQSSIPIGTIIQSVGAPDGTWFKCNGDILAQSDYPAYVANCDELHPLIWKDWGPIDVDQSQVDYIRYDIDRIGDILVAVGSSSGTPAWVSSDGGETWSTTTDLPSSTMQCIGNNGTQFITTGYNIAYAYLSSDGVNWTSVALPSSDSWTMISGIGNLIIIASSDWGATAYVYSTDGGASWNAGTFPFNGYCDVLYNDGTQFILFASDGYEWCDIYTSTDAINWTVGTDDFYHNIMEMSGTTFDSGHYIDGVHYVFGSSSTDKWFLKFDSNWGNILNPVNWEYNLMPAADNVDYWQTKQLVYTGEHFIIPNRYNYAGGILVGQSMNDLTYHHTPFGGVQCIINSGDDYAVLVPYLQMSGWRCAYRSIGTSYDRTTHFQLPLHRLSDESRIYSYIKLKE